MTYKNEYNEYEAESHYECDEHGAHYFSDYESDNSEPCFNDETIENPYDDLYSKELENYRTIVSEKSLHKVSCPPIVQLAAETSEFETMKEMTDFYDTKFEREERASELLRIQEDLERLNKICKENQKKEKNKPKRPNMISDMSRAEVRQHYRSEGKKRWQVGKLFAKNGSRMFGHRRNGGGKRRAKAKIDLEAIKARRAHHRKEVKENKKKEEDQRHESFKNYVPDPNIVDIDFIKDEVLEDWELIEEDLDLTKQRHIVLQKITDKEQMEKEQELKNKKEEEKKERLRNFRSMALKMKIFQSWKISKNQNDWNVVCHSVRSQGFNHSVRSQGFNHSVRSQGFNDLTDHRTMEKKLKKTRMCKFIAKNQVCKFGNKCHFAHSLSELEISECFFKHRCRYVRCVASSEKMVYINTYDSKICKHMHPEENINSYYQRINPQLYIHATTPPRFQPPPPRFQPQPPKSKQFSWGPVVELPSIPASIPHKNLSKTRQCKYFAQGKHCPHKICRFIHA